jgi:hypothetical protein
MGDMPEPVRGGNGRKEHAQKFTERYANRRNGSSLDDEKQCPAEQKSPERPERLAQVNVLAGIMAASSP